MTTTLFEFMQTERGLDDFLRSVPGLAPTVNFLQTVRECDELRIRLKRAICLVEMHRAHYVDLTYEAPAAQCVPLDPRKTRVFFDSIHACTDAFVWGTTRHEAYLTHAQEVFRVFREEDHEVAKRIVGVHKSRVRDHPDPLFDVDFFKRLVQVGVSDVALKQRI